MTRNMAMLDERGRRLKTHAITIENRAKAPIDAEAAAAARAPISAKPFHSALPPSVTRVA
jgi:hypothetical protein